MFRTRNPRYFHSNEQKPHTILLQKTQLQPIIFIQWRFNVLVSAPASSFPSVNMQIFRNNIILEWYCSIMCFNLLSKLFMDKRFRCYAQKFLQRGKEPSPPIDIIQFVFSEQKTLYHSVFSVSCYLLRLAFHNWSYRFIFCRVNHDSVRPTIDQSLDRI